MISGKIQMKNLMLSALIAGVCVVGPAFAVSGDAEKGKEIYMKRCVWCHGEEGDGESAATERLNPPPRDFTSGMYKIKTSGRDDMVPNDEDIFRMIKFGMPGSHKSKEVSINPGGTAMPGWGDMLSDKDIWDLVATVKEFSEYTDEKPEAQVDYSDQISSSPDSIEKGKELFNESERCTECHGSDGKGDAIKALKGDAGDRTWPRNLTKAWTFRGSNSPKDIFTRITTGIPGTQMPSFADPSSKKSLSAEDRWHVANYVNSLAKTVKVVDPSNSVIQAGLMEGDLPSDPNDPQWEEAAQTTYFVMPQFIGKERHFTPANDTITMKALFNATDIALLFEWDDRTKSVPGDEMAIKVADPDEVYEDAVAIQMPVTIPKSVQLPYFGMGDISHPVNIWQWKVGTTEKPESIELMNSTGFANIERRDAAKAGIEIKSAYSNGTWKVVMKRSRTTDDAENDLQFEEGKFIPVAFATWDGSNNETGSKHTMTTWYWLILKAPVGAKPTIMAILFAGIALGGLIWWARSAVAARREEDEAA
ncbi:hypothetical protein MNBD_GAMMA26-881 [hydrothermal vent metagenome]|uniref:Cytochrome c domain-containing protein n=1 Tax=hydrothermal vent metagenome TaxID=652676 RepID=A0A3B1BAG9_9ZZZZ